MKRRSSHFAGVWLPCVLMGLLVAALSAALYSGAARTPQAHAAPPAENPAMRDPAAWGADHVGQPVPEFVDNGECLFCHRTQVGTSWKTNRHNQTVRPVAEDEPALDALKAFAPTKALAGEVQLLVGGPQAQRFLKRSQAYGKFDLLSPLARFGRGKRPRLEETDNPHWDAEAFGLKCAGCHTTGVDSETHAFSTPYIDCFSCHGVSPEEHANDAKLMPLAKARQDSPEVVTSICASCHIRFGKSKSTGLPYPTNFVAGDNLFRDFEVDWKVLDDPKLNPGDAHVLDNIRDVVLLGRDKVTCLNCHDVHNGTSAKHRELPVTESCQRCHTAETPIKGHKTYEVHSERCGY